MDGLEERAQQEMVAQAGQNGSASEAADQEGVALTWDPIRLLPSTLGDPGDEKEGGEGTAEAPLDRKVLDVPQGRCPYMEDYVLEDGDAPWESLRCTAWNAMLTSWDLVGTLSSVRAAIELLLRMFHAGMPPCAHPVSEQALEARALQSLTRRREQARNMQTAGSLNFMLSSTVRRAPPSAKTRSALKKTAQAKRT
jgi:hypothetical protein